MHPLRTVAIVLALTVAAGCGVAREVGLDPGLADTPPPVVLHLADGDRALDAWSWCFANGCADGAAPEDPVDVGRPDAVGFSFALDGWTFDASFREPRDRCFRQVDGLVEQTGDRTFEVTPAGPAGTWDVDLTGRGPEGDVVTTFRWTTPTAGDVPAEATGSAAVLADHDGSLDSYGVEVFLDDLAGQPRRATASLTVESAAGNEATIALDRQRGCYERGALGFSAPRSAGLAATRIGDGPFTYEVRLDLDGTPYVGRGAWPDDESAEMAPHVPLTWTPPLPVFAG